MIFWRSLNSKQMMAALNSVKIALSKSKTDPKAAKKTITRRPLFFRKVAR